MHKKTKTKPIEPFRKAALELADLANSICQENNIKYTLLGETLWGAAQDNGFLPWESTIKIGMFYNDYIRFIDICKKKLNETQYYIIDSETGEQFEEVFSRLAKRSKVTLPELRKKDEVYYDYHIEIIPIFYAGDTLREYKEMYKNFVYHRKIVSAFKIATDTIKLKNVIRMARRYYYYKRRTANSFLKLKECLMKYNNQATKYVLIPSLFKQKQCVRHAKTYDRLEKVSFEGHEYFAIANAMEWVEDFYGKKRMEVISRSPINKATLEGPETLRRIQLIELEMLIELDRICRKHNLKYTLATGTLLGAVRHGGFIPWDDDIDVCMLYEDYKRFIEIANTELDSKRFFVRTQETDKDCNLTFAQIKRNNTVFLREGRGEFNTHRGVFIDIFPLFNGSTHRIIHCFQDRICKFFKTMTWAHMGAQSERHPIKKWYYTQLARVSNKKSYLLFLRFATMIKRENNNVAFLSIMRNPIEKAPTKRSSYENLIEMNFEGHSFFVPKDYKEILSYYYSEDYMRYPVVGARVAKHLPNVINIGDLYKFSKDAK